MDKAHITLSKVKGAEDLPLPKYMSPLAAGMDLAANIFEETSVKPGEYQLIPCGVKLELPQGYEAQLRPRSGLAARHGITLLNSPGTIDADYRGEIKAIIINHGREEFKIKRGDRIAQLVFAKIFRAEIHESDILNETLRGDGGFGHTGI